MSEDKIVKAWGTGCARSILIAVAAWLVIVLVFVGLVTLIFSLPVQPGQRVDILSAGFLIILFVIIFAVLFLGVFSVRRRLRQVDSAFAPLGLDTKAYLWNGRQYHGTLDGRRVDAYFYRGPTLDIYLETPLKTRMGIGPKSHLTRLVAISQSLPTLVTTDPELAHLTIHALDETWSRELLAGFLARAAILRLMATQPGLEFRNLLFQPEALHLQIAHASLSNLTADKLRQWTNDLLALSRIAASLPPPTVTATATASEHAARTDRSALTLPVTMVACGTIVLVALLAAIAVLLFYLDKGGFW